MTDIKVIRKSPIFIKSPGSGVMEYWSVEKKQLSDSHYSNTPVLQHFETI